jgi:hypothetical protein
MLSYWVSFLAYPNLFGIKGFVVVVVVVFYYDSTQECFKASWSAHKSVHTKSTSGTDVSSISSEKSQSGWLYCLKKGQMRSSRLPNFEWTGYFHFLFLHWLLMQLQNQDVGAVTILLILCSNC